MQPHNDAEFPALVQNNLALLEREGIPYQLKIFERPAYRASQAAELLECELGAVVKSLVFLLDGKDLLLVLASGENRVDLELLETQLGQKVSQAKPGDVRRLTGYEVGSVPPFGIPGDFPVLIDEDLLHFAQVWAAGGSAHILVGLSPETLQQISGGKVMRIKQH